MKINKKELIIKIADEAKCTQKEAVAVYDAFMQVIADAIVDGNAITLQGIGKIEGATKKPRLCMNPQTGKKMKIGAKKRICFTPSKTFVNWLNED